jgi:hypothetical protein
MEKKQIFPPPPQFERDKARVEDQKVNADAEKKINRRVLHMAVHLMSKFNSTSAGLK